MAKTKKINYSDMTQQDLEKSILEEKKKLNRMEFNHAVSPLPSPIELRSVRRNIARMLTSLSAK